MIRRVVRRWMEAAADWMVRVTLREYLAEHRTVCPSCRFAAYRTVKITGVRRPR